MQTAASTLEMQIGKAADEFTESLGQIGADDPNLKTAIAKMATRDVAWALLSSFPESQADIAEMLEIMSEHVRQEKLED